MSHTSIPLHHHQFVILRITLPIASRWRFIAVGRRASGTHGSQSLQLPAPRSGAGELAAFRTPCQRQLPTPGKPLSPNYEERRLCARKPGHAKRVIGLGQKNLLTPYPPCFSLHFSHSRATHLRAQTCRSPPYVEAHFIAAPRPDLVFGIWNLEFGIWNLEFSHALTPHSSSRTLHSLTAPTPHSSSHAPLHSPHLTSSSRSDGGS